MTWWQYVGTVTQGATQDAIARRVGSITASTVNRWQGSTPKPETVAAFARAYGRPVVEAFVAAGFMQPDDTQGQVTINAVDGLSDLELLDVLRERISARQESGHDTAATTIHAGESPAPDDENLIGRPASVERLGQTETPTGADPQPADGSQHPGRR